MGVFIFRQFIRLYMYDLTFCVRLNKKFTHNDRTSNIQAKNVGLSATWATYPLFKKCP